MSNMGRSSFLKTVVLAIFGTPLAVREKQIDELERAADRALAEAEAPKEKETYSVIGDLTILDKEDKELHTWYNIRGEVEVKNRDSFTTILNIDTLEWISDQDTEIWKIEYKIVDFLGIGPYTVYIPSSIGFPIALEEGAEFTVWSHDGDRNYMYF